MNNNQGREGNLSLPSRERGLKSKSVLVKCTDSGVAPFTGAWIEIASQAGVVVQGHMSLPSRERGLKFDVSDNRLT